MKQNTVMTVGVAAAFAVCGVGWAFLPALTSDAQKVETEVALRLERARRLLYQYHPELTRQTLLLDQLRNLNIDPAEPDELSEKALDEYQRVHDQLWSDFEPHDWRHDPPRPARATYGNIPADIRRGLSASEALADENRRLLDQAAAQLREALAVTTGTASGLSSIEANNLQSAILYFQGVAESLRAAATRQQLAPHRRALDRHIGRAIALKPKLDLIEQSGIDAHIKALQEEFDERRSELDRTQQRLAELDETVHTLEQRLADAESRQEEASETIRKLRERGMDLRDPHGPQKFREQMLTASRALRQAERDVAAITYGDYPNAEIDASGDFLNGRYVENGSTQDLTVEHGLLRYRDQRAGLADTLTGNQNAIDNLTADLQRLRDTRARYEAEQAEAQTRIADARQAARTAFDEISRIDSEAVAIEENALQLFDRAARAAQQASSAAQQWTMNARERTQGLSPTAAQRSAFAERQNDEWMSAYTRAGAADANLAKAWMHFARYQSAKSLADALANIPEAMKLAEADAQAQRTKAADAREAGTAAVQQAVSDLQRAHRDADRHWTLVAQAAGANYLMVLFDYPQYLTEAIQAYRNALQGREHARYAEPLADRLRQLEARQ